MFHLICGHMHLGEKCCYMVYCYPFYEVMDG